MSIRLNKSVIAWRSFRPTFGSTLAPSVRRRSGSDDVRTALQVRYRHGGDPRRPSSSRRSRHANSPISGFTFYFIGKSSWSTVDAHARLRTASWMGPTHIRGGGRTPPGTKVDFSISGVERGEDHSNGSPGWIRRGEAQPRHKSARPAESIPRKHASPHREEDGSTRIWEPAPPGTKSIQFQRGSAAGPARYLLTTSICYYIETALGNGQIDAMASLVSDQLRRRGSRLGRRTGTGSITSEPALGRCRHDDFPIIVLIFYFIGESS